jgi:phosphodiesterase/alkaline phosphatase D-like protein
MPIRQETYGKTDDPRTAGKPKLYRYRTFGSDAAIFVLDARSFRDTEVPGIAFDQVTDKAKIDAFLASTYKPGRTLLGKAQLDTLKADLLAAQKAGVTWKFILLPEPIQNLGIVAAQDRYEGYAAERADLLAFIKTNNLANVVFITADFHGTIINNLAYQTAPDQALIPVDAWEIITGPVAFAKPFGPTVIDLAAAAGLLKPEQKTLYSVAPVNVKDSIIKQLVDAQMKALGYDPVGLQDSSIPATLIKGDYVAAHVFGWTEFEIDAQTQTLLVTTYGIPWYTQQQLDANPQAITGQMPQIVSQFSVKAKG